MKKCILQGLVLGMAFMAASAFHMGCSKKQTMENENRAEAEDGSKNQEEEKAEDCHQSAQTGEDRGTEEQQEGRSEEKMETPEDYYAASGFDLSAYEIEQTAKEAKQYLLNRDWKSLASICSYPLEIEERIYQSPEELLADGQYWKDHVNPLFLAEIEAEDCREMFCSWQGIMMGSTGAVWLQETDGQLKVCRINHMTEAVLPSEIGMRLEGQTVDPQALTVLLTNDTELSVVFTDECRLKKQGKEGQWEEMTPLTSKVIIDVMYMPKRGEPVPWTINLEQSYGPLEPGIYSLEKDIRIEEDLYSGQEMERALQFSIE